MELLHDMSFIDIENRIGERMLPCGVPVLTMISTDSTGSLQRGSFSLTRCGRSHINCLIYRIKSGLTSSINFLIRT